MKMADGCHIENGLYLIHASADLYEVWNAFFYSENGHVPYFKLTYHMDVGE